MFKLKRVVCAMPAIAMVAVLVLAGTAASRAWGQGSATTGAHSQPKKEYPKDVDPISGSRLPALKREDLDDYGKKVADKILGTPGRITKGFEGPSGIRMYSPQLAEMATDMSSYLRYKSGLNGRVRELAILITARELDSVFEWAAHEGAGLKEGLAQSTIDVVKYRKSVDGLSETEAVVIQLGRQLFGKKKLDSETYARALKIFGPKHLVDLVALMGYYSFTALQLAAFDLQVDAAHIKYVLPMP